jgi:phosphoribosylanthranilate isomerase
MMIDSGNPRTRVKVCGLTTLEDARYASGAMADYLGFIFTPTSKRYIDPDQAAAIIAWTEGPQAVGVFVNQAIDDVVDIVRKTGIHLVQLHGDESVEYCSLMPVPVIKAFSISKEDTSEALMTKIQPFEGMVDFFLFDTKSGNQFGGTGTHFDWRLLKDLQTDTPFFLAGGIGPENVHQAIDMVQPYAIDANSKLESEPGIKQLEKFEAFFDQIQTIWKTQDPD